MKLIIAGSRHLNVDTDFISECLGERVVTRVISGGAKGIDLCGEAWAVSKGLPYVRFVPGWGLHGRRYAAYVRNHDMGFYADELVAFWDGKSPGTKHMIATMEELKKPVEVIILAGEH